MTVEEMKAVLKEKNPEFQFHKLNEVGIQRAQTIQEVFDTCLNTLKIWCHPGREFSIVKTKLEEACFFAKKSMAVQKENQDGN